MTLPATWGQVSLPMTSPKWLAPGKYSKVGAQQVGRAAGLGGMDDVVAGRHR